MDCVNPWQCSLLARAELLVVFPHHQLVLSISGALAHCNRGIVTEACMTGCSQCYSTLPPACTETDECTPC